MKIWFNGEISDFDAPTLHPLSTALKYGAGVFEGIRGYWNDEQKRLHIFRLDEHIDRLMESAKILRFAPMLSPGELKAALLDLIDANNIHTDVHIRIQVLVDDVGGFIDSKGPLTTCITAVPMGRHFPGPGKNVAVSSWRRIADSTMPPRIKSIANYENSRLALLQAQEDGYDDTILLTQEGHVSEGPGYNVFIRRGEELATPRATDGILEGITRDSILKIAQSMGIHTSERRIDRTELYVADEVFFCGTAGEVTPILSVDRLPVQNGQPGSMTLSIRERYLKIARNQEEFNGNWLTTVNRESVKI